MSKGITCPCPHCRKIVLRYCNFKGEGSLETICPHCRAKVKIKLEMQPCVTVETVLKTLTLVLVFVIPICFGLWLRYKIETHQMAIKAIQQMFASQVEK